MTTAPRPADGERGFVLVGVVIFVIALTIIGLSLFSLSGYEAQFLSASMDAEQAYQSALGGLEHARVALCAPPYDLEAPGRDLPLGDLVAASAVQYKAGGPDSIGTVEWDPSQPVVLRVTARHGARQRTLEARFEPMLSRGPYSYLLAVSGHVTVEAEATAAPPPAPLKDRRNTTDLRGPAWEGGAPVDTSWATPFALGGVLRTAPDPGIRTAPLAAPDLNPWFLAHPVLAAEDVELRASPAPQHLRLQSSATNPRFYRAPSAPDQFHTFDWYPLGLDRVHVQVNGLAVWEFPRGVRFEQPLHVYGMGGGNDCLVIVAGPQGSQPSPNHDDPTMGIRLFGGLVVDAGVSVVLVSSGRVAIQHMNNYEGLSSAAEDLCVYAENVTLTGPWSSPPSTYPTSMTLQHLATGPTARLDNGVLDLLATGGALPNVTSARDRRLDFVAGSWRVIEP